MAPMHSGFLEEYPLIRVDNFTSSLPLLPTKLPHASRDDLPKGATHFSSPHVSLLSHPHTDHLAGLASQSRQSAPIYCSEVTKGLLLALERKADRERFDAGLTSAKKRPYRKLRVSEKERQVLSRESGTSSTGCLDLLVSGIVFFDCMQWPAELSRFLFLLFYSIHYHSTALQFFRILPESQYD